MLTVRCGSDCDGPLGLEWVEGRYRGSQRNQAYWIISVRLFWLFGVAPLVSGSR